MLMTYISNSRIRYNFFILLSYLLFSSNVLSSLTERSSKHEIKVSVIIPCYYKHFNLIPTLLKYYVKQTVLPDEVVISLSECHKVPNASILKVSKNKWPFTLKILKSTEQLSSGQNRNRASAGSSGDLLIYQDADDIPHPKRVELIKYIFEKYKVNHLIHCWDHIENDFPAYNVKEIVNLCQYCESYVDVANLGVWIHNGNIAISRSVYKSIQWPEFHGGEDVIFNKRVYEKFPFKVVMNAALLHYRPSYVLDSPALHHQPLSYKTQNH